MQRCQGAGRRWAALCAVTVLSACGGNGPSTAGPLGPRGLLNRTCIPRDAGPQITFGTNVITNTGGAPIEMEAVQLTHPADITLDEAMIVSLGQSTELVGLREGFPPVEMNAALAANWQRRRLLAGALIQPGETVNVVVLLTMIGPEGSSQGFQYSYRVGRRRYRLLDRSEIEVRQRCTG